MEGLYSISGTPKKRIAGLPRLGEVSTAKDSLDMKILHDRLEIEQKLLNRRAGGALPEEVNAIYNQWKRDVVEHATVSGIGIHGLIPNPKSLLSNIKGELKDAAVEHFDKAAPLYVYNFVNSDAALNKLPSTVRNKRVSSKNAMNTFAGVGVSADQAMGVIRNGAMKVMVNTPEQYFANELTKLQVSRLSGPKVGVIVPGDAEIAFKILKDAGAFLKKVWDWIKKLFGGKVSVKVPNEENHIADQTDWAGFQPDVATVEAVGGQASNQTMIEKYGAQIAAAIANGQDVVALVAQLKQQMENEPAENGGAIKTEKEVTVTSKPKEKSDNTGLLLGLAGLGAAAYFLTKKKGKR